MLRFLCCYDLYFTRHSELLRAPLELADRLLLQCVEQDIRILAPSLLLYEIIAVTQKRGKNIKAVYGHIRAIANIEYLDLSQDIVGLTLNIVEQTGQLNSGSPSFYDACYHSIALLNNCDFITADKKHYEKTKALGNIRLLQDVA